MATPLPPQGSDASRPRQHDSWGEESCLAGEQHPLAQARGSCFDGKQLKSEFLEIYKDSYGYPGVPGLDFDAFCRAEFPQLQGTPSVEVLLMGRVQRAGCCPSSSNSEATLMPSSSRRQGRSLIYRLGVLTCSRFVIVS